MIKTEVELIEYLQEKDKYELIFPSFKMVKFNVPINGFFSKDGIGMADIIMFYKQKNYVIEAKHNHNDGRNTSLFWDALKVLGYARALSLYFNKKYYPMVMLHKKVVTNDILVLIGEMKLDYITFEEGRDGYIFDIFT